MARRPEVHRRQFLSATALGWVTPSVVPPGLGLALCLALGLGLAHAEPAAIEAESPATPHQSIALERLRGAVARRFPMRYAIPGLLRFDLQAPRLRLLPAQNRLSAEMFFAAVGPALERSHQGSLTVEFALRYEASDQSIRAHQLRVQDLQLPSLQAGMVNMLNNYAPAIAEQSLLEVVVYQLSPQDLALSDAMGMRPNRITVTAQGIDIGFALKPQ